MKKLLLLLFIVLGLNSYSQVGISMCSVNSFETIDLTTLNTQLIAQSGQSAGSAVSYYATQADATAGVNAFSNPSNYFTGTATLFARIQGSSTIFLVTISINPVPPTPSLPSVTTCNEYFLPSLPSGQTYWTAPNGAGITIPPGTVITASQTIYVQNLGAFGCASYGDFTVTINPSPNASLNSGYICNATSPGSFLLNSGLPNVFIFEWYLNGVLIPGATGNTYLTMQSGNFTVVVSTGSLPSCSDSATAQVYDSQINNITLDIVDQNVVINGGLPNFTYALDGGGMQPLNIFANLALGNHTIVVIDGCANAYSISFTITTPSAPFGQTTQTFNVGQTLADVVVTGQNIQWYANASSQGRMAVETPLPLTTVLVNGTTYYASQTINGIESSSRFPVTVTVGLGVQNNAFQSLSYYPNPVKNTLSVSNIENIDSIVIYDVLGQSVLSKLPNDSHPNVDTSLLNSGVYLVKIKAGNQQKTFRITKE